MEFVQASSPTFRPSDMIDLQHNSSNNYRQTDFIYVCQAEIFPQKNIALDFFLEENLPHVTGLCLSLPLISDHFQLVK